MNSIIAGSITTIAGTIIGYFLGECSNRRKEIKSVRAELKEAFLDEIIRFERAGTIEIEGTKIYNVLIKAYPKHCAAVHRFRSQLDGKKLIGFNVVWHQYQYPDENNKQGTFGFYITPDKNGCNPLFSADFVLHKINCLLREGGAIKHDALPEK